MTTTSSSTTGSISSAGIGSGLDVKSIISSLMAVEAQPLTLLQDKATSVQTEISAVGQIQSLTSTLSDKAHALSGRLTQVDMRKLELARAIACKPALLISDEAMAGLSASEVDEILALLLGMKERGVAVIMIEHVMRAVMKFSERIAVLVAGRKIADGEPQAVVAQPDVVTAYLG